MKIIRLDIPTRYSGPDVAIFLDYRTTLSDPRVVSTYWTAKEDDWKEVSPTFF
ncbi:MAG: hypothetical protein AAF633_18400 [Chloroflexota bacterium]